MKMRTRLLQCSVFLFSAVLISACGSSGGGGAGQSAIPYNGKTTQAKLTPENSGKILSEVQDFGGGVDDAALLKAGESALGSRSYRQVYDISQHIQSTIASHKQKFAANKAVDINETEAGSCGGQLTITGSIDDESLIFDVTGTFDNFCEGGTTISGSMNIKGNDGQVTMTISSLTISDATTSISMSGSFKLESPSSSKSVMTMDVVIRDNETGSTVKLENYRVESTAGSTGETIILSGRFYSPDNGFIDISTSTPIFEANGNEYPSSGVLEIVGSNGTKARITALNASQFKLEVDADGDGTFELMVTDFWKNLETSTPLLTS